MNVYHLSKRSTNPLNRRIWALNIGFSILGILTIFNLFSLQVSKHEFYTALAENQQQVYQKLIPKRGEIFFQDFATDQLYPLAVNKEWPVAYAVPNMVEDKERTAEILASLLPMKKEDLIKYLNKPDDPYEPLKSKLSDEVAAQIRDLNLKGIGIATETGRYYPGNTLAASVSGFVGFNSKGEKSGQYGIEEYYEEELKGKEGFFEGRKDIGGYFSSLKNYEWEPAQDGDNLILTIDSNIQFLVEEKLREVVERFSARSGTIIVMEPSTGAIRGMASFPNFDLNNYSESSDISVFLNPAIHFLYEPGSVFKPITVAAALDQKVITPQATYEDKGSIQVDDYLISNSDNKPYGEQTMTNVLEKSLNTGAIFIQQKLGKPLFKQYLEAFGFNKLTGIDLIGESKGNISNLDFPYNVNYATASFGQGIAVTPIELITAISAIANQGKLMKPFLAEKIIKSNGEEITTKPLVIREVISPETSSRLTAMLVSVILNGHSKKAQIPGYYLAGKTGTAQIPEPNNKGYSEETIHSFVGFGPAFSPRFSILIKLDRPQGVRFADGSITPVFKDLAEFLLNYYRIPPDEKTK